MLEQLFGSRTRVKLLRLFLSHPEQRWFVRELTRLIHEQINSVRRELLHLETLGLVKATTEQHRKYYQVDTTFGLYPELKALIVKARLSLEKNSFERVLKQDSVKYLALTGYFVDDATSVIDVFIVGTVQKTAIQAVLDDFKDQFGQQLRFTLMTPTEYYYRHDVTDKFLFTILNAKKIVLVDRLARQAVDRRI
jgi:hypothetical protein